MGPNYALAVAWVILLFWLVRSYSPSPMTYLKSFGELACVFVVGNIHYFILLFDFYIRKNGGGFTISEFIKSEVKPGEILVYISAVLAPVTYTFLIFYKSARPTWFIVQAASIAACLVLGIWIFGRYRSGSLADSQVIRDAALILYCASLILCFFSAVYDRALAEGGHDNDGSKDLLTRVQRAGY